MHRRDRLERERYLGSDEMDDFGPVNATYLLITVAVNVVYQYYRRYSVPNIYLPSFDVTL